MKNRNIQKQQGAALAVGLIILVIVTLMGYTGMKSTMLQERMAAGLHNRSLANSGAHSVMREAEEYLFNLIEDTNGVVVRGDPTGSNDFKIYSMYNNPGIPSSGLNTTIENFKENDWSSTTGTEAEFLFTGITAKGAALSVQPQYMVQQLRETWTAPSPFGGAGTIGSSGSTHEFGGGGSSSGGSNSTGAGGGGNQDTYLITAKSRSGDGNSYSISESIYTVVTSSSPTN